jgi:hypothetical protein
MIHLLLALLAVQSDDEVVKKLSDESVDVRKEMSAALVKKGRASAAQLRRIADKEGGQAKAEAQAALAEISSNEVKALLESEKVKGIGDLQVLKDDAVAKQLPSATVYLLSTSKDDDDSGRRVIVVNSLDDPKGAPVLLKKPGDIVPLLPAKAGSNEEAEAVVRAALYLLRATHPLAHSDELVPAIAWDKLKVTPINGGGWQVTKFPMKFGHDYQTVDVAFDESGRLTGIVATYTGESCK